MALQLEPSRATDTPYADVAPAGELQIPGNLGDAVAAFQADSAMREGFGSDFLRYYSRIKTSEQQRFDAADDKLEFQRREYFARI
jgi:glutamine synthetase